ncbi:MAG: hypothetical protein KDE48_24780 [Anaerolineales bacterium]|nr:hypothetical protein [Anaerolineales bacterium]
MWTNLTLVILLIVVAWLLIFVFYLITSRKQKTLETHIEKIQNMLPPEQKGEDA